MAPNMMIILQTKNMRNYYRKLWCMITCETQVLEKHRWANISTILMLPRALKVKFDIIQCFKENLSNCLEVVCLWHKKMQIESQDQREYQICCPNSLAVTHSTLTQDMQSWFRLSKNKLLTSADWINFVSMYHSPTLKNLFIECFLWF